MYKKIISVMSVALVVFLCTSFPVFANTDINAEAWKNVTGTSSDGKVSYNIQVTQGYKETDSFAMTTNPNSYVRYSNTHLYVWVYLSNDTDQDVQMNQWTFKLTINTDNYVGSDPQGASYYKTYKITEMRPLSDDNFATITRGDASSIAFSPSIKYAYQGKFAIPKHTALVSMFEIVLQGSVASGNPSWALDTDDFNFTYLFTDLNSKSFTSGIFPITAEWYSLANQQDAYADVNPNSSALDQSSSAAKTQSDQVHQQELSYYNQTNQAISGTGIQNFQFNNEQVGGIGAVSNDFSSLWSALGSWNNVYVFTLTLSLALFIIRYAKKYS